MAARFFLLGVDFLEQYEELLDDAADRGLTVYENMHFQSSADGLISGSRIGISNRLKTYRERSCVLAEEIAHADLSSDNILDLKNARAHKQEQQAHMAAFDRLVGLSGIVRCFEAGCRSLYEMAELLDVTEEFLKDALEAYRLRYGDGAEEGNYRIVFEPFLCVVKMI